MGTQLLLARLDHQEIRNERSSRLSHSVKVTILRDEAVGSLTEPVSPYESLVSSFSCTSYSDTFEGTISPVFLMNCLS